MQFAVPQFTEVEDRLIGSLTLKQFLVLLAAGGIILFFWSILGPSFPFFLVAIPIGLFGIAAALGKYNGRPLFTYLVPLAAYMSSNKVMIFKRETNVTTVSRTKPAEERSPEPAPESLEPAESRLKKLAYLLDNKAGQEVDIISHDVRNDIVVPQAPRIDLTAALTNSVKQVRDQVLEVADQLDGRSSGINSSTPPVPRTALARPDSPRPRASSRNPQPPQKPKPRAFDPSSFLQI